MQWIFPGRLATIDLEASEHFDCAEVFGHGRFQRRAMFVATMTMWVMHCHTLAFPLISAEVDHWCKKPADRNISEDTWKGLAIPRDADEVSKHCTVYAYPDDVNDTSVVDCYAWDYDSEFESSTIVSRWSLVCHRQWLTALANAVIMAGALGFLTVFGYAADRVGRRLVIMGAASVILVATFGCCFATSYQVYVCTKFFISGCSCTLHAVSLGVLIEVSTHEHRAVHVALSIIIGTTLADIGFAILKQLRGVNWVVLQLLMVAPTLLVPTTFLLVKESPRWLLAQRRYKEAEQLMVAAASANHFRSDGVALLMEKLEKRLKNDENADARSEASSLPDVLVIRRRAVIMFSSSFSVMFAYYALLLSIASRRKAWIRWTDICVTALVCGVLVSVINRLTRTTLVTGSFLLLGSSCCILGLALTVTVGTLFEAAGDVALVLAKASCFAALTCNFVYVGELFPAPVLGTGGCFSMACARLGGVLGALVSTLRKVGREDLLFTLIAAVVYGAAWLFRFLPKDYSTKADHVDAETASRASVRSLTSAGTYSKQDAIDNMKTTLCPLPLGKVVRSKRFQGAKGQDRQGRSESMPSTTAPHLAKAASSSTWPR